MLVKLTFSLLGCWNHLEVRTSVHPAPPKEELLAMTSEILQDRIKGNIWPDASRPWDHLPEVAPIIHLVSRRVCH